MVEGGGQITRLPPPFISGKQRVVVNCQKVTRPQSRVTRAGPDETPRRRQLVDADLDADR